MVALVQCIPCGQGKCDDCVPRGPQIDGLIGGWRCSCSHTPEERRRAEDEWQEEMARMFDAEGREDGQ